MAENTRTQNGIIATDGSFAQGLKMPMLNEAFVPGRRPGDFGLFNNKVYVRLLNQTVIELGADTDTNGPWSVVLAAGNTSGANNAIMSSGQGLIFVSGIAIGNNSGLPTSSVSDAIAIGSGSTSATGFNALVIGNGATSSFSKATAIGFEAVANGASAISVGSGATTTGNNTIAIGTSAQATVADAAAIGNGADATASGAYAIGPNSNSGAQDSIAFGRDALASHAGAVAIGPGSKTDAIGQIKLGSSLACNQVFGGVGLNGDIVSEGFFRASRVVQARKGPVGAQNIPANSGFITIILATQFADDYQSPSIGSPANGLMVRDGRSMSGCAQITVQFSAILVLSTDLTVQIIQDDGGGPVIAAVFEFHVPTGQQTYSIIFPFYIFAAAADTTVTMEINNTNLTQGFDVLTGQGGSYLNGFYVN